MAGTDKGLAHLVTESTAIGPSKIGGGMLPLQNILEFLLKRSDKVAAIFALNLLTGCMTHRQFYALERQRNETVLRPPLSARSEVSIKRARSRPVPGCNVAEGLFSLRWSNETAIVSFKGAEFYADAQRDTSARREGVNSSGAIVEKERFYLDPLAGLDVFRQAILQRVEKVTLPR